MTDAMITLGVLQGAFGEDMHANIETVKALVREAAGKGAQVILPPELFQGPYFCTSQKSAGLARPIPRWSILA